MSQRTVRVDDRTGETSTVANPPGWLTVTVAPVSGGTVSQLDFTGWKNFREWVELSDPGFGHVATGP